MDMSAPTPEDMDCYPTVFFTSDSLWDPSILDGEYIPGTDLPEVASSRCAAADPCVTDFGDFIPDPHATYAYYVDLIVSTFSTVVTTLFAFAAQLFAFLQYFKPNLPDADALRPNFAWVPVECIRKTLSPAMAVALWYSFMVALIWNFLLLFQWHKKLTCP